MPQNRSSLSAQQQMRAGLWFVSCRKCGRMLGGCHHNVSVTIVDGDVTTMAQCENGLLYT
jgi:hypothetical protein